MIREGKAASGRATGEDLEAVSAGMWEVQKAAESGMPWSDVAWGEAKAAALAERLVDPRGAESAQVSSGAS